MVRQAAATPTAIVVNPGDFGEMLAVKSSGSGMRLDSDGAFGSPPDSMWGYPIIQTLAMPAKQALVADFTLGARLYIREAPFVRVSDADQNDFTANRVTALAELRAGFAVWQAQCFALVNLTFPS
jgi:HK97 family phage major capsid protein